MIFVTVASTARADEKGDAKPAASRPRPRVTISKETTVITAPLRDDGYPDYIRYLNEKLSQGVTPENNAIIPIVRVMGIPEFEGPEREQFFRMLGIEALVLDGDYFVRWEFFAARVSESEQPKMPLGDDRSQSAYFKELNKVAMRGPWTRKQYPHLVKWIDSNHKHFPALIEASKLPGAYAPMTSDEQFPPVLGAGLVAVTPTGDAAEALLCRAMLRAGENDVKGALEDLLACQRLARLLATQGALVDYMLANRIDGNARDAAIAWLASAASVARTIRRIP